MKSQAPIHAIIALTKTIENHTMTAETSALIQNDAPQDFRRVKTKSPIRGAVFVLESLLILALYVYLLHHRGIGRMRGSLLVLYGIIYFVRLNLMALYLLPRAISMEELTFVMIVWVPGILASFASIAQVDIPISLSVLTVSVAAYVAGSYLNTMSEWQRKKWKATHPGQCYTEGLFRYSRNINYFGDVVLFAGWAIATSSWWNAWVPLTMAASFYYIHIPTKEDYLAEKYGDEWVQYRESTMSFIPRMC